MKRYLIILIFIFACSSNAPENLISEEKMESIIFDIMILNASSSYDLKIDNNMISDELIFRKPLSGPVQLFLLKFGFLFLILLMILVTAYDLGF